SPHLLSAPPPPLASLSPYTTLFRSLFQRHLSGAGDGRVHVQTGDRRHPAGGGADIPVHPGPEGIDVLLGDGKARRQLMAAAALRSEEHTSELQSRFELVCRLLLEKK